jgi:hypothetical protein
LISFRRRAAWALSALYRIAAVHRARGEILSPRLWLEVLANILSSAAAGLIGKRNGHGAPANFGLTYANLLIAAERCGLEVTGDTIAQQIAKTLTWREKESERIGRQHYFMMRPDVIGKRLGITDETRADAKAWCLGTYGGSPEQRRNARRERDRLSKEHARRVAGAKDQANSAARTKPWLAEGISERTWYRRRRESALNAAFEARGTISSIANKADETVAEICLAQKNLQPISGRGRKKSTANKPDTRSDAAVFDLASPENTIRVAPDISIEDCSPKSEPSISINIASDRDLESAIETLKRIKGEPAPFYRPEPGELVAALLAAIDAANDWRRSLASPASSPDAQALAAGAGCEARGADP